MLHFSFRTLFIAMGLLAVVTSCEIKDIELKEVQDVEISSFDKGKIDGKITVLLNNPNGFGVTVKDADFIIFAGKTQVGTANLKRSFRIDAREEKSYPIELNGDASDALAGGLSAVVGMLFGKDPKVVLRGNIKVKGLFITHTFPVDMETDLKLSDFTN